MRATALVTVRVLNALVAAYLVACPTATGAATVVVPTIEGEVRLHHHPKRISEERLRELILLAPYEPSTFIPPSLEQCVETDPAYHMCGTRTPTDPSFLYNAEINLRRGRDMLDAIDRLAPPLALMAAVDYIRDEIEFYVCLHEAELAYYRGDNAALHVRCGGVEALAACPDLVAQSMTTRALVDRHGVAGYAWHNCINDEFREMRDAYPLDAWRDFLELFGIDEEIVETPTC
jgi:hypothetical protein